MKKELVFLSKKFYEDHPLAEYAEFERKANRPYIVLLVKIEDRVWGIPFRSHIAHEYAFWTDREKRCGIDYSKAVVIDKEEYVIGRQRLVLRPREFDAIRGQEFNIYRGFVSYINTYKKARRSGHRRYASMLKFSTLQYYDFL